MATQPISNLVTTWNAAGTTFTAIKMNVTDTASAAASRLMDLQVGGSSRFSVSKLGRVDFANAMVGGTNSAYYARNDSAIYALGSSDDVVLNRDAADTLAQRRGTNAQAFRVYNTFTDASNYERLSLGVVTANRFSVQSLAAGTGTQRPLDLNGAQIQFQTAGTARWEFNGSGHLLANVDNTYDIGASGANRPRNVYVAGSYFAAASVAVGSSVLIGGGSGNLVLKGQSSGVGTLLDTNQTDFNRLQFGGTTSSFPALKRNGAILQVRLADDSSSADLTAAQITANASTTMPAGGAVNAGVRMSTTANFGVFFGSGAPTLSAAKGSLYLRSDGTTTNDRAYINTDGATTWTALTTAA